ncbi:MAG: ribonuclease J [Acidobacteria bacterium]|nr:ribonuclease J [Acidobacteriota bacterium]
MSASSAPLADAAVDVVPLGGLGEFGLNMMAVSCGETTIIIDAGTMFPEADLPGVDLVVPSLDYLDQRGGKVDALILTHGHEDHIGGVPYVLPRVTGPVLGTPFTLALVDHKIEEHGQELGARARAVQPGDSVTVGPVRIEFIRVTHSIPDCVAVAIHTPQGVLIHTGDFKIDYTPLDHQPTDLSRLAELGAAGVLALFADSTNVDRRGVTGSETDVRDAFDEVFATTEGKVVVAAFASSIYRMQLIVDLAAQFNRSVAFVGRGMITNSEIAQRLGYLRVPTGVAVKDSDVGSLPPGDVVCLVTGSQGEPNAALSRIAIDDHRHISLGPDDTVVLSARAIPGNEKGIGRVVNHLARRGVDVVTEETRHVHVSGHGSADELKLVLSLVRPKYLVPVHGEFRQLSRHGKLAQAVTGGTTAPAKVLLAENGHRIRFDAEGGRVLDTVPTGRVLIDGTRTGEVDGEMVRHRRQLAADGLVVPVVVINRQTGLLEGVPELVARGFVPEAGSGAVLTEAGAFIATVIGECSAAQRSDEGLLKELIRGELRRFLKRRTGRRPMVLPVVMEI